MYSSLEKLCIGYVTVRGISFSRGGVAIDEENHVKGILIRFRMFTFAVCVRDQQSGEEVNLQLENLPCIEPLLSPIVEHLRDQNFSDSTIGKIIPPQFMSTTVDISGKGLPPTNVLLSGQPLLDTQSLMLPEEHMVEDKEQLGGPVTPQPPNHADKKVCEYCGTLVSSSNMRRHVAVKHLPSSTSFQCGHCGKSFPTKDRCNSHEGPCRK